MKKLETALILRPLLDAKDLPWGIVALVTAIFEDTRKQLERQQEQVEALVHSLTGEKVEGKELARVVEATLHDPTRLSELSAQLDANPVLRDRLQRQAERGVQEFEEAVMHGEIELDLFSEDELLLGATRFNEYLAAHPSGQRAVELRASAEQLAKFMQKAIGEIMTPARTEELQANLDKLAAEWLALNDARGALLEIEKNHLDDYEPSENPFLFAAYVGQTRRWGEIEPGAETEEPEEKQSTDARSKAKSERRSFKDKFRALFEKK